MLSADGRVSSELSRRLGAAAADFTQLATVWKHANISRAHKVRIFTACVVQRLLYCLHTVHLNKAELRKVDGFQVRRLRQIFDLQHAFFSKISNKKVYNIAGVQPLSMTLLERQLRLFGKMACKGDGDPMRACVFEPHTVQPRTCMGIRQQGRPRQTWAKKVHAHALAVAGVQDFEALVRDRLAWRAAVRKYIASMGMGEAQASA